MWVWLLNFLFRPLNESLSLARLASELKNSSLLTKDDSLLLQSELADQRTENHTHIPWSYKHWTLWKGITAILSVLLAVLFAATDSLLLFKISILLILLVLLLLVGWFQALEWWVGLQEHRGKQERKKYYRAFDYLLCQILATVHWLEEVVVSSEVRSGDCHYEQGHVQLRQCLLLKSSHLVHILQASSRKVHLQILDLGGDQLLDKFQYKKSCLTHPGSSHVHPHSLSELVDGEDPLREKNCGHKIDEEALHLDSLKCVCSLVGIQNSEFLHLLCLLVTLTDCRLSRPARIMVGVAGDVDSAVGGMKGVIGGVVTLRRMSKCLGELAKDVELAAQELASALASDQNLLELPSVPLVAGSATKVTSDLQEILNQMHNMDLKTNCLYHGVNGFIESPGSLDEMKSCLDEEIEDISVYEQSDKYTSIIKVTPIPCKEVNDKRKVQEEVVRKEMERDGKEVVMKEEDEEKEDTEVVNIEEINEEEEKEFVIVEELKEVKEKEVVMKGEENDFLKKEEEKEVLMEEDKEREVVMEEEKENVMDEEEEKEVVMEEDKAREVVMEEEEKENVMDEKEEKEVVTEEDKEKEAVMEKEEKKFVMVEEKENSMEEEKENLMEEELKKMVVKTEEMKVVMKEEGKEMIMEEEKEVVMEEEEEEVVGKEEEEVEKEWVQGLKEQGKEAEKQKECGDKKKGREEGGKDANKEINKKEEDVDSCNPMISKVQEMQYLRKEENKKTKMSKMEAVKLKECEEKEEKHDSKRNKSNNMNDRNDVSLEEDEEKILESKHWNLADHTEIPLVDKVEELEVIEDEGEVSGGDENDENKMVGKDREEKFAEKTMKEEQQKTREDRWQREAAYLKPEENVGKKETEKVIVTRENIEEIKGEREGREDSDVEIKQEMSEAEKEDDTMNDNEVNEPVEMNEEKEEYKTIEVVNEMNAINEEDSEKKPKKCAMGEDKDEEVVNMVIEDNEVGAEEKMEEDEEVKEEVMEEEEEEVAEKEEELKEEKEEEERAANVVNEEEEEAEEEEKEEVTDLEKNEEKMMEREEDVEMGKKNQEINENKEKEYENVTKRKKEAMEEEEEDLFENREEENEDDKIKEEEEKTKEEAAKENMEKKKDKETKWEQIMKEEEKECDEKNGEQKMIKHVSMKIESKNIEEQEEKCDDQEGEVNEGDKKVGASEKEKGKEGVKTEQKDSNDEETGTGEANENEEVEKGEEKDQGTEEGNEKENMRIGKEYLDMKNKEEKEERLKEENQDVEKKHVENVKNLRMMEEELQKEMRETKIEDNKINVMEHEMKLQGKDEEKEREMNKYEALVLSEVDQQENEVAETIPDIISDIYKTNQDFVSLEASLPQDCHNSSSDVKTQEDGEEKQVRDSMEEENISGNVVGSASGVSSETDYMKEFTDDDFKGGAEQFDVDYLEGISSEATADPSELSRKSLFVKFDPLVSSSASAASSTSARLAEINKRESEVSPVEKPKKKKTAVSFASDLLVMDTPPKSACLLNTVAVDSPLVTKAASPVGLISDMTVMAQSASVKMYTEDEVAEMIEQVKREEIQGAAEKYEPELSALRQELALLEETPGDEETVDEFRMVDLVLTSEQSVLEKEKEKWKMIVAEHERLQALLLFYHEKLKDKFLTLAEKRDSMLRSDNIKAKSFEDLQQRYSSLQEAATKLYKAQGSLASFKKKTKDTNDSLKNLSEECLLKQDELNRSYEALQKELMTKSAAERAQAKTLELQVRSLEKNTEQKEKEKQELTKLAQVLMQRINPG